MTEEELINTPTGTLLCYGAGAPGLDKLTGLCLLHSHEIYRSTSFLYPRALVKNILFNRLEYATLLSLERVTNEVLARMLQAAADLAGLLNGQQCKLEVVLTPEETESLELFASSV